MPGQIFFEDVIVGGEINPLVKHPTTRQLVMWAGATSDYNPIHYDKDFAVSHGLPGVIVHGQLVGCFLGQLLTDWAGRQGRLQKLTCSYKGMNYPGETITCRGQVSRKYEENGKHCIECTIWAENPRGEKTVFGKAVVVLPVGGSAAG
jgi:acyl dehydratase